MVQKTGRNKAMSVRSSTASYKSAFERLRLLVPTIDEAFLLHAGKYFFEETVEGAAEFYLKTLLKEPANKARAKALGII